MYFWYSFETKENKSQTSLQKTKVPNFCIVVFQNLQCSNFLSLPHSLKIVKFPKKTKKKKEMTDWFCCFFAKMTKIYEWENLKE